MGLVLMRPRNTFKSRPTYKTGCKGDAILIVIVIAKKKSVAIEHIFVI
jgi:hypothetical protein